jgi:SAM-dependent methyltransferase
VDIDDIATGLRRDAAGYWIAPETVRVSYPAGGHEDCLAMEEESFWFAHRNRAIVALLRRFPPAGGPVFDIGAGNGYVTAALERAGFETVAIEPSRAGAANAAARVGNVVCGSLPSAAFRPASAGAIGLFDVIEHIEDDRAFLRSLAPYLKSGGRLYATVPAFPWLWSSNDVRSGHHRRYTRRTLRETLRARSIDSVRRQLPRRRYSRERARMMKCAYGIGSVSVTSQVSISAKCGARRRRYPSGVRTAPPRSSAVSAFEIHGCPS